eukprot:gene5858-9056_t
MICLTVTSQLIQGSSSLLVVFPDTNFPTLFGGPFLGVAEQFVIALWEGIVLRERIAQPYMIEGLRLLPSPTNVQVEVTCPSPTECLALLESVADKQFCVPHSTLDTQLCTSGAHFFGGGISTSDPDSEDRQPNAFQGTHDEFRLGNLSQPVSLLIVSLMLLAIVGSIFKVASLYSKRSRKRSWAERSRLLSSASGQVGGGAYDTTMASMLTQQGISLNSSDLLQTSSTQSCSVLSNNISSTEAKQPIGLCHCGVMTNGRISGYEHSVYYENTGDFSCLSLINEQSSNLYSYADGSSVLYSLASSSRSDAL